MIRVDFMDYVLNRQYKTVEILRGSYRIWICAHLISYVISEYFNNMGFCPRKVLLRLQYKVQSKISILQTKEALNMYFSNRISKKKTALQVLELFSHSFVTEIGLFLKGEFTNSCDSEIPHRILHEIWSVRLYILCFSFAVVCIRPHKTIFFVLSTRYHFLTDKRGAILILLELMRVHSFSGLSSWNWRWNQGPSRWRAPSMRWDGTLFVIGHEW